jgi:hypothetical protein
LSLYYIESGCVIVYLKASDTYLKELSGGDSFGEFGFLTGCKRFGSVKAKGYVNSVKFERKNLLESFEGENKEHLALFKYCITIYTDFSPFDVTCYSCKGKNHMAKYCKYTHLEINKRNLIRSKKVETNDRKNWIRKNRRQFSAVTCFLEIITAMDKLSLVQQRGKNSRHSLFQKIQTA